MSYTAELKEKRAKLVADARAIQDAATSEKRSMNSEEAQKWDRMHADVDALKQDIDRLEKQEASESELSEVRKAPVGREDKQVTKEKATNRQVDAFRNFLRAGVAALPADQQAELRALSVGTNSAGGFTVPTTFADKIIENLRNFSSVRQAPVTVIKTDSGSDIIYPTVNDTSVVGELVAEGSCATESDPTFGNKTLKGFNFSSKMVKVSIQLLQDSAVDVDELLTNLLAGRIAAAQNAYFTAGTGSAQPEGIVTGSGDSGIVAEEVDVVSWQQLVRLEASVPAVYRRVGKVGYMFNDATLAKLKLSEDVNGAPLWQPGIAAGEPDKINGHPYYLNSDMPLPAAGNKAVLFGDFSAFVVRDIRDVQLVRLVERYADCFQIGFLAYQRADSRHTNSGALKYLKMAAS